LYFLQQKYEGDEIQDLQWYASKAKSYTFMMIY